MSGRGTAWTAEEDTYLREHVKDQSREEIAAVIGRTVRAIDDRCHVLDVHSRKWSQADTEYIQESWGKTSIPEIAKRLGRSVNAVKLKAGRLGMGRHLDAGEMVTFFQLIQVIGCAGSYSWLRQKWARYGFPFHRKKSISKKYLMVDIEEFWKWAEKHQDILDFSRFERYGLGKEPAWVDKKRKRDYRERRNTEPWTAYEDERLRHMLDAQKYSLDQVAAALGRREGAIRRRIATLGIKDRPVRNPGKWWTAEETETMTTMHRDGHTWEEIGAALGRTASACRGKYERILNPEQHTQAVIRNKAALRDFWQRKTCTHYTAARGCDIGGTDCDTCGQFCRRAQGVEYTTGWISAKAGCDGRENIRRATG